MENFKGIIFDLDGTAIINQPDAHPSKKLIEVISKVNDQFFVTCATGRDWPLVEYIVKDLGLTNHCIISAGTEIIDPKTEEIVWSRSIGSSDLQNIINILKRYSYAFYFDGEKFKNAELAEAEKKTNVVYIMEINEEDVDEIINLIKQNEGVEASKVHSWKEGKYDVHVVNSEATKQKAVAELCRLNNLNPDELIGVGDGENDIPLLNSIGYSVAMGNAMPALKEVADEITDNVESDGLAKVISKYLL